MLKNVSQYKDQVSAILSGINLNSVTDLNGTLERAARTVVQRADIPEASGIQNITLYPGVTDYECDTTIFGTAVNDIRPQGISRPSWDTATKTTQQQFDRLKAYRANSTRSTFQYENGVPIIRIVAPFLNQGANLDKCTQVGNWTASGTASTPIVDTSVYYQSPASLRYTVTTGAGIVSQTLSNSIDLSSYEDVGVAFLASFVPADVSNLTSITLKIGSDSSNYNSVTATTPFIGAFTDNIWQLVAFDFSTASQTGTPDWTAIDYIEITDNVTGTITNIRIGSLFISLPTPSQILFQSAAIFLPSGSTTALTTITANTDTIVLNDPAYNLYLYEGALAVLENTSGGMGDAMYERLSRKLGIDGSGKISGGLYGEFLGDNPSQELRTTSSYYDVNQGGASGYGNLGIVY